MERFIASMYSPRRLNFILISATLALSLFSVSWMLPTMPVLSFGGALSVGAVSAMTAFVNKICHFTGSLHDYFFSIQEKYKQQDKLSLLQYRTEEKALLCKLKEAELREKIVEDQKFSLLQTQQALSAEAHNQHLLKVELQNKLQSKIKTNTELLVLAVEQLNLTNVKRLLLEPVEIDSVDNSAILAALKIDQQTDKVLAILKVLLAKEGTGCLLRAQAMPFLGAEQIRAPGSRRRGVRRFLSFSKPKHFPLSLILSGAKDKVLEQVLTQDSNLALPYISIITKKSRRDTSRKNNLLPEVASSSAREEQLMIVPIDTLFRHFIFNSQQPISDEKFMALNHCFELLIHHGASIQFKYLNKTLIDILNECVNNPAMNRCNQSITTAQYQTLVDTCLAANIKYQEEHAEVPLYMAQLQSELNLSVDSLIQYVSQHVKTFPQMPYYAISLAKEQLTETHLEQLQVLYPPTANDPYYQKFIFHCANLYFMRGMNLIDNCKKDLTPNKAYLEKGCEYRKKALGILLQALNVDQSNCADKTTNRILLSRFFHNMIPGIPFMGELDIAEEKGSFAWISAILTEYSELKGQALLADRNKEGKSEQEQPDSPLEKGSILTQFEQQTKTDCLSPDLSPTPTCKSPDDSQRQRLA